jgi:hypothetical protein
MLLVRRDLLSLLLPHIIGERCIASASRYVLVEGELLVACITLPLLGDVLRRIIPDTAVKHFHGTLAERTLPL